MDEHNSKYPRMDWDAKDLPLAFKSFKEHCNFMFKGLKLIIPKKLRNEMLDIIHSSHFGIVKCNKMLKSCAILLLD